MKIGIDVSQMAYETGVSVYTRSLVKALLEIDRKNDYLLFGGSLRRIKNLKFKISNFEGKFESKVFPIPPTLADILGNRLRVGYVEVLIGRLDVFHSSDWSQPCSKAFKVTTIHDLTPLKFPEETHPKIVSVHQRKLAIVKKEVDRIIVPSEATKVDLIGFGFDEEKIRVIFEAPAEFIKKSKAAVVLNLKKKHNLGRYLLVVGTKKRKNVGRIIKAFGKVKRELGIENLVVIGQKPNGGIEKGVVFVGIIPDDELSVFYTGAEALVYVPLYEGFGLPVLEAFTCECPVITSNTSSLPEVAGNAAVLVDPKSVDAISDGIKRALGTRPDLIKKGLTQVKTFSWQKAARETLKVYQEAQ